MYTSTFLHDAKTWKTLEKPIIALIILKNKERVDFEKGCQQKFPLEFLFCVIMISMKWWIY